MFTGSSVQIMVQFILIAVLAHLLTPADFGVMSVILIFANFTYIFTSGIAISLIQAKEISKIHISSAYTLSLLVGFLFTFLFYFVAEPVSWFFEADSLVEALRFFAYFLPLKSINSISEALLRRKLRFAITVKCTIFSYIFGFGVTSVVLALMGFSYWSMIYGQLCQLVMYTLMLFYFEKPIFRIVLNTPSLRKIGSFSTGYTVSNIFNFMAENADNTITGKVLGVSSLGIYSRAFQFLSIPSSFFGQIFDNVLLPVLSSRQENRDKLASFYMFSLTFCFIILFPVSVFLLVNANFIVLTVLGEKWIDVILPFQILILALGFRFGTRINKSYLTSIGMVYKEAYYQLVFAILVISLTWGGAKWLGLPGVSLGVLAASVLHYLQTSYRLKVVFGFSVKAFIIMHFKTFMLGVPLLVIVVIHFVSPDTLGILNTLLLSVFTIVGIYVMMVVRRNELLFNSNNIGFIGQIVHNLPAAVRNRITASRIFSQIVKNPLV